MTRITVILFGAFMMLLTATASLVIIPYFQLADIAPPPGLKPYTAAQLAGRKVYVSEGCVYCHSQQPRDPAYGPDTKRGWGRASVPADYVYDKPHLLGTMRTGPDLLNIGRRQPSEDWHLLHLYQPRAVTEASIMPSYPYLFRVKPKAEAGDKVVNLPPQYQPADGVVVASIEARELVAYLLSLDRTYPIRREGLPVLPGLQNELPTQPKEASK
jgi:cytochrome c oxidase cbb3-type subunit II